MFSPSMTARLDRKYLISLFLHKFYINIEGITRLRKKKQKTTRMQRSTHDKLIEDAVSWAESLGYEVVEYNLGRKTGPDAVFQNLSNQKVILEIVTGSSFKELFKRARIKEKLVSISKYKLSREEFLGLIVVADRINNVKKHAVEVGFPAEFFDPNTQKIFTVRTYDFKEIIPVLLVSLLGSRARV